MTDESVKRGRESRETWAKRVRRWRESGLTSGEFCAEVDLNPHTLIYWAWRLRKEGNLLPEKAERKAQKPKVPPTTAAVKHPDRRRQPLRRSLWSSCHLRRPARTSRSRSSSAASRFAYRKQPQPTS